VEKEGGGGELEMQTSRGQRSRDNGPRTQDLCQSYPAKRQKMMYQTGQEKGSWEGGVALASSSFFVFKVTPTKASAVLRCHPHPWAVMLRPQSLHWIQERSSISSSYVLFFFVVAHIQKIDMFLLLSVASYLSSVLVLDCLPMSLGIGVF